MNVGFHTAVAALLGREPEELCYLSTSFGFQSWSENSPTLGLMSGMLFGG